jgi:hypothetical protein
VIQILFLVARRFLDWINGVLHVDGLDGYAATVKWVTYDAEIGRHKGDKTRLALRPWLEIRVRASSLVDAVDLLVPKLASHRGLAERRPWVWGRQTVYRMCVLHVPTGAKSAWDVAAQAIPTATPHGVNRKWDWSHQMIEEVERA